MKFLFNKRTGLSVYGAGVLFVILLIIAAIAASSGSVNTAINPETNPDYVFYQNQSSSKAMKESKFFETSCGVCHTQSGKGPVSFETANRQKLLNAIEKRSCPGYKYDKTDAAISGKCALCHKKSFEELQFDPAWAEYSDDTAAHPEITGFYKFEISEGDLADMKRSMDFTPGRMNAAQWFALIMAVVAGLGMLAWSAVWIYRRARPKQEKYLA